MFESESGSEADDVHCGGANLRVAARATVLATAYAAHPERFPAGLPHPPARPVEGVDKPTQDREINRRSPLTRVTLNNSWLRGPA